MSRRLRAAELGAPRFGLAAAQKEIRAGPLAAVVSIEGVDEVPGLLLERDRPPAVRWSVGCTQASSVIPVVRSRAAVSVTVTQSLTPSNESAPPFFPAAGPGRAGDRAGMAAARDVRERGAAAGVEGVRGDQRGRRGPRREVRGVRRRRTPGAVIVCVCAPPSDQDENVYDVAAEGLRRDGADGVRGADDHGAGERRGGLRAARRRAGARPGSRRT